MSEVKANDLVTTYLAIRREREKLSKKFEQEDSVFKDQLNRLEDAMLNTCNDKEFLSTRGDEGLPPGISTMREFKITVRKPTT